jgi:hypothetical protein
MKTEIQLVKDEVYSTLVTLPFLYEKTHQNELYIDEKQYRIKHVRDMIELDGSILRLIFVFKTR